jgi:phytoene desaturase
MSKPNTAQKVIIVGAGLGGLTAAAAMAKAGHSVTVIEKNEGPGGRATLYQQAGYSFDLGPSWYMMPEVFANFFKDCGKDINDYLKLVRLDPSYKIYFDNKSITIPSNVEQTVELFESIEAGSGKKLRDYLGLAKYKYDTAMQHYIYKTYDSLKDFFDLRMITSALRMNLFGNLENHVGKYFKNDYLQKILKFMVVFIGGSPKNVPALYSLLAHTDMNLGIWYPMGGMIEVPRAFEKLGKELGVKYIYNEAVNSISPTRTGKKLVVTERGNYEADIVIVNADYHHAETKLLAPEHRSYKANYWEKLTLSPSTLLFYIGIGKKLKNLEHHTLVMDKNWDNHFAAIFDKPEWPTDPLYYLNVPSITDPSVAPAGKETMMILVPIAPGLNDTEEIRERYYQQIIANLEQTTGQEIGKYVEVKRSFAITDFMERYNAYKGNAFGLAHTLFQTAIFRPQYKSRKIPGLYYTGQFTIPGVGLPIAVISGKIVAERIIC